MVSGVVFMIRIINLCLVVVQVMVVWIIGCCNRLFMLCQVSCVGCGVWFLWSRVISSRLVRVSMVISRQVLMKGWVSVLCDYSVRFGVSSVVSILLVSMQVLVWFFCLVFIVFSVVNWQYMVEVWQILMFSVLRQNQRKLLVQILVVQIRLLSMLLLVLSISLGCWLWCCMKCDNGCIVSRLFSISRVRGRVVRLFNGVSWMLIRVVRVMLISEQDQYRVWLQNSRSRVGLCSSMVLFWIIVGFDDVLVGGGVMGQCILWMFWLGQQFVVVVWVLVVQVDCCVVVVEGVFEGVDQCVVVVVGQVVVVVFVVGVQFQYGKVFGGSVRLVC